jgi:hypothetical protein
MTGIINDSAAARSRSVQPKLGAKSIGILLAQFAACISAVVWVGGFMFYGGVVVPILDETMGSLDAGMITRQVTNRLNVIGCVAILLGWGIVALDRNNPRRRAALLRLILLCLSMVALFALIALHFRMDEHLDRWGTRNFRPWHRMYLMVSTGQWLANLGIIATTIGIWMGEWNRSEV